MMSHQFFCLFACLFQDSIKSIKIELFSTSYDIPYQFVLWSDMSRCQYVHNSCSIVVLLDGLYLPTTYYLPVITKYVIKCSIASL